MAGELVPITPNDLHQQALAAYEKVATAFFDLGRIFYHIKLTEAYADLGYGSYVEYIETVFGTKARRTQTWIAIWEKFHQHLGYEAKDVVHIGWSKLSKISDVVDNRTEANKWLKRAGNMSRDALVESVKAEKARRQAESGEPEETRPPIERHDHNLEDELSGDTGDSPFIEPGERINTDTLFHERVVDEDEETGEVTPMHKFSLYLFEDQWRNVMQALEAAGKLANSSKPCHLLDVIATEFNASFVDPEDGGLAHSLDRHVKNLERVFGVKITVDVPPNAALMRMSRLDDESLQKANKRKSRTRNYD